MTITCPLVHNLWPLMTQIKDLSIKWTAVTTVSSFAAGHILRQLIEPAD